MAIISTKYGKTKEYDTPLYLKPVSTQEALSIKSIEESGIFELNNGRFSKLYTLSDVNFLGITQAEQIAMIQRFGRVMDAMPFRFSYTIANEYVDEKVFNNRILYHLNHDKYDSLKEDYNAVIKDKLTDAKQGLYQTLYMNLTCEADDIRDAKQILSSNEAAVRIAFKEMGVNGIQGSSMEAVSIDDRMQQLYKFTHTGLHTNYSFSYETELTSGRDWMNAIAPPTIKFAADHFELNGKVGKVMYVSDFPKMLQSDILITLSNINCTSYITVCSELLDVGALKQEINRKHTKIGLKIENEKSRNRKNNDYLSDASDSLVAAKAQLEQFNREVDELDDHYFNSTVLICFIANDLEDLKKVEDKMISAANIKSVVLETCFGKQREALNTVLPIGIQEFKRHCNFASPCLAMLIPFKTQELNDYDGTYYGLNQLSQNAIIANRKNLQNRNGLILGKSGSGKSMFAKSEIISYVVNNPDDQMLIIDPQNEYRPLASVVGGTVVSFDTSKNIFLNPLDVDFQNVDYAGLQEIIAEKSDFVLTLLSSCLRRDILPEEQTIIDEVVESVYSDNFSMRKRLNGDDEKITEYSVPEYMRSQQTVIPVQTDMTNEEQIRAYSPTLQDIYQGLLDRDDKLSKKLAAAMGVFVNGSLNLFNHKTNIDMTSKFIVFDLAGIKENLRITAMLVMLETVRGKIKENFALGNWTSLYIDEFHELLGIDSVAGFVVKLWKEIRKCRGILTGITQNLSDLLNSEEHSTRLQAIISNSEYFALLNQSTLDRDKLMALMPSVSPAMFNFVENAASGTGLLRMGNVSVPFDMRMSKESAIYKIINTDGNTQIGSV